MIKKIVIKKLKKVMIKKDCKKDCDKKDCEKWRWRDIQIDRAEFKGKCPKRATVKSPLYYVCLVNKK